MYHFIIIIFFFRKVQRIKVKSETMTESGLEQLREEFRRAQEQNRREIDRLKKSATLHAAFEIVTAFVYVRDYMLDIVENRPKQNYRRRFLENEAHDWRDDKRDRWNKLQRDLDWVATFEALRVIDNAVGLRIHTAHPPINMIYVDMVRDHLENPECLEYLENQGIEMNKLGKDLTVLLEGLLTLTRK